MELNTAFVYLYKPTDVAEQGTFIAFKSGMYPDITDVYSMNSSYIESDFQLDNESEFKVIDVFSEEMSAKIIKLHKDNSVGFPDEEDGDDKTYVYSFPPIRELLVEDYPELFI